ncbi:hypothetical protein A9Q99_06610 [Gammaproteobacteria bacterium 45_16_T64]|nr:hypothetical protein A9Q99_06610 [Gammaproteobacteria bacterium 45_16_T64]
MSHTESNLTPNSPFKAAVFMIIAVFISAIGLFAAATTYGNAEDGYQPKPHRGPDFSAIADQLSLTDEQLEQLEVTLKSHHESRRESHKELRQKHDMERKEAMTNHKGALDQQLANFLSAAQLDDLHTMLEKNKPRRICHKPSHKQDKLHSARHSES